MTSHRHRVLRVITIVLVVAPGVTSPAAHAQSTPAPLTVERIFGSREFAAAPMQPVRWLDDSSYTVLEPTGGGVSLVRVAAATGERRDLVSVDDLRPGSGAAPLAVADYQWSADHARLLVFTNTARVWRENTRGDYWVLDLSSKRLRQLGGPAARRHPSTMQFAKFSPDGKRVAYVRDHNVYVETVAGGAIVPLTTDGSATIINGTFDWVYEEELGMRDGIRWSPDGTRIAYWQLDTRGVRDFLLINNTDSLYAFTTPVQYPKVGTTISGARIGVVPSTGGRTTWMQIPGDRRQHYLARMDWADNSTDLAVQQLTRRQTQNTLYFVNATSGRARGVLVERDSAWFDIYDDHEGWGPGPSLHWTTDGSAFIWITERDGWRHAWLVNRAGTMSLVTRGTYDAMKVVHIDMARGWLYFYASPGNATQLFLYRTRLDGSGAPERLTPAGQGGRHAYEVSPGGSYAVHTWSSWGDPPRRDIVSLPAHRAVRTLVTNDSLRARLAVLDQGEQEFMQVDIGDGRLLDAYLMKPPHFDPSKRYPILFHVYGEPWSQTVTDAYGGGTWLWHLMLTQQGYLVASIDQRGTPGPKGRAWRKAVYGRLGGLRVEEQSLAARQIASRPYVDTTRMGMWGWSGGGSTTLHLMFRAPGLFRMGMAVAPVADVRNYDATYQERYTGLWPQDSAAYRDASAINFAEGLRGDLLLVHGTGDDNVHYQGTEQLINRLVAAGKPFDVMTYPNRTHGIFEGRGTTVHLYTLLTRYLQQHLMRPVEPATLVRPAQP